MKVLITGGAGFIGSHIVDDQLAQGNEVYASYHRDKSLYRLELVRDKITLVKMDVRDEAEVESKIREIKPDLIFHMAAQSYVTVSWERPRETYMTNVMGTFNILETVRKLNNEDGYDPVVVVACSSAEYGVTHADEIPINEDKALRPTSPYAVTKVGQDMMCYQYHQNNKLKVFRIRFFNISGPRKTNDAASDFAKRIVEIEKGKLDELRVGNLEAIRDITDVRDAVRGLNAIVEGKQYGEVYNVCSNANYKIADIVDTLISKSERKDVKPEIDEKLIRPLDDPIFVGDNSKVKKLGWSPEIPIEKTLEDMLVWWRTRI